MFVKETQNLPLIIAQMKNDYLLRRIVWLQKWKEVQNSKTATDLLQNILLNSFAYKIF